MNNSSLERWREVERLLDAALELPVAERAAFLDQSCAGDAELRREVERLIQACERAEGFLAVPAQNFAGPLLTPPTGVGLRERLEAALGGAYAIERELGRGGMATVYLARDRKHDRPVAMKVLHPEVASAVGAERFLREIRVVATLRHPHILPLYDSGEADDVVWYTMPFVEGGTLRHRLTRERRLSLEEVQRLAQALASALDYAHAEGIVHRDIKPENILLYRGAPMLADFGVALPMAGGDARRLTRSGVAVGTPAYMSPEQATGRQALDARSDVYSLACVLYEALAGEPPHTGPNRTEVLSRRLTEPAPSLRAVRHDLPQAVEQAIGRALARSPADRPATAGELAAALQVPAARQDAGSALRTRRAVALATGVAVLALTAVLGMLLRESSPPPLAAQNQLTFTGSASFPSVSPDGKWLAYVSAESSLVLQELGGGVSQVLVPKSRLIFRPRWSPDGSSLAFVMYPSDRPSNGATYIISRRGGTARKVIDDVQPFAWDPSGRSIVRAFGDTLSVVNVGTGRLESVISLAPRTVALWHDIAISPDGRWIAVSTLTELGVLSRDGRQWQRVGGDARQLRWGRGGEALYYLAPRPRGAELMKQRIDRRTGRPLGKPTLVLSGLSLDANPDLTADGATLVYERAPVNQQIWTMSLDGRPGHIGVRARQRTTGTIEHARVDVSPDGQWLAYVQLDTSGRNIFVAPFLGGDARRITSRPAEHSFPRWSPDGRRLAYVSFDSSGQADMLWDRETGRAERLDSAIARAPILFKAFAWGRDGSTIVYATDRGRMLNFLRLAARTKIALPPPDSSGSLIAWAISPDGQEVVAAQVRRSSERFALWRTSLRDRTWREIRGPNGDAIPLLWGTDGWIYLWVDQEEPNSRPEIWRLPARGGAPERYLRVPLGCVKGDLALSQDLRRMACKVKKYEPDIWLVSNFDPTAK